MATNNESETERNLLQWKSPLKFLLGWLIAGTRGGVTRAKIIDFSLILLFYTLSSNPLMQLLFGYRAAGLAPFAMLPDLFTTFALAVLLYLTMK